MRLFIAALTHRLQPQSEAYFRHLADGSLERDAFLRSQAQFRFAVDAFPRMLLALAARCDDPELVASLHANVADELGQGSAAKAHSATFRSLLRRLGAPVDTPEGPEVAAFNAALCGICLRAPVLQAVAVLGMIEDLFSGFSATLADGIAARGWLKREQIVHYHVHRQLDSAHAEDFYRFLDGPWQDPGQRPAIRLGLELGARILFDLYRNLHAATSIDPDASRGARRLGENTSTARIYVGAGCTPARISETVSEGRGVTVEDKTLPKSDRQVLTAPST